MVAYERWCFDSEYFGILENWSLRRGGRLRQVVATGGSTVSGKRFSQLFITNRESIEFEGMLGNKIFQDARPRKLREDVSS